MGCQRRYCFSFILFCFQITTLNHSLTLNMSFELILSTNLFLLSRFTCAALTGEINIKPLRNTIFFKGWQFNSVFSLVPRVRVKLLCEPRRCMKVTRPRGFTFNQDVLSFILHIMAPLSIHQTALRLFLFTVTFVWAAAVRPRFRSHESPLSSLAFEWSQFSLCFPRLQLN